MSSETFTNVGEARRVIRDTVGAEDITDALKYLASHRSITNPEYQRCVRQADVARARGQEIAELARNLQHLYSAGYEAVVQQIDALPPTEGGGVRGITAPAKLAAEVAAKLEALEDEYHMLVAAILATAIYGDDH